MKSPLLYKIVFFLSFVSLCLGGGAVSQAAKEKDYSGKTGKEFLEEEQEKRNEEIKKRNEKAFQGRDIEDYIYPKDKTGCSRKSMMFMAFAKAYKEGKAVSEVVDMKMMEPLVERVYEKIREVGYEQAALDNMEEFESCVDKAEPHPDEEREKEISDRFEKCEKLNSVIMDILSSIKERKKPETVMKKYETRNIDLSGTTFGKMEQPILLFIGQLYETSEKGSYQDAVERGSEINSACFM